MKHTIVTLLIFVAVTFSATGVMAASTQKNAHMAADLLLSEISRDEEIVASKMNITRLKQTRIKLGEGLAKKRDMIKRFRKGASQKLGPAIQILKSTLADEATLSNDTRIGQTSVIRAGRLLKRNIELKREAYSIFNDFALNR